MRHKALTLFLALTVGSGLAAAETYVHAGTLIDGISDKPKTGVTIVIENDRIVAVHDGFVSSGGDDSVINLRDHTVMPGLMDMHVHLHMQHSKDAYTEEFFMEPREVALRGSMYAKRTLLAGFTTVRDLGDDGFNAVSLRKAIDAGWIIGPRIYCAGKALATTGGHADPTNGLNKELKGDPGPREGVVNGTDDARKAVRQRYKDGADLIKLTATGGVLSLAKSGQNPQFKMDELEAIVSTANDYGMTVAVHAHGAEGMKRAVEAGVTSIEHGTFMTDEIMRMMKRNGTVYVPTILAGVWVGEKAQEPDYFPAIVRPKAATIGPVIQETFAKAYKAGVTIAFGTDTGVSPHGENAREFELMVEAGMPPMEAIQSATMGGAKLLRIQEDLGSVETGKIADLVAVPGNPLENISLMKDVSFVMKAGTIYKSPDDA
jgi:imidazolonepropionase-like amidohydrolase